MIRYLDGTTEEFPMGGNNDPGCPLHAPSSLHAENVQCYVCAAWFFTTTERDEHEASCGLTFRG